MPISVVHALARRQDAPGAYFSWVQFFFSRLIRLP